MKTTTKPLPTENAKPQWPNTNERIKELIAQGYTQGKAFQQALIEKREWVAQNHY